jgi:hypothetical protein
MGNCFSKNGVRAERETTPAGAEKKRGKGDKAFMFGVQPPDKPPSIAIVGRAPGVAPAPTSDNPELDSMKSKTVTPSEIQASFLDSLKHMRPNSPMGVLQEEKAEENGVKRGKKNTLAINLFLVPCSLKHLADEEELQVAAKRRKLIEQSERAAEVVPGLLVSGCHVAERRELLAAYGISDVLNVAGLTSADGFADSLRYYSLDLQDTQEEDISGWFVFAVELFNSVRARRASADKSHNSSYHWCRHSSPSCVSNFSSPLSSSSSSSGKSSSSKLLVHCTQGVSRSCSFVIAIIMALQKCSYQEAYTTVRSTRTVCKPNPGFVRQLLLWERVVSGKGAWFQLTRRTRVGGACVVPQLQSSHEAKADEGRSYLVLVPGSPSRLLCWTAKQHEAQDLYAVGMRRATAALVSMLGPNTEVVDVGDSFATFLASTSSFSSSSPTTITSSASVPEDTKSSGGGGMNNSGRKHHSNPLLRAASIELSTAPPKLQNAVSDSDAATSGAPSSPVVQQEVAYERMHQEKEEHELDF